MASPKFTVTFILGIIILLPISFQHVLATRPLYEDQVPSFNHNLILLPSLQKGPVPPSAGNPCTNIPGRNHGRCTLTEMNIVGGAGGIAHQAPPPFPDYVVKFGAASTGSKTDQQ
ncbi:hypothetical protein REPUB_Repub06bG0041200 [Reevesia pubescens]